MTTKNKNAITIDDVLAKKKLLGKYDKYYSNYFGKEFEITKLNPDKIIEVMNGDGDEYEKYSKLIYLSCPFFRGKELQRELEIENPYDTVGAVFNDNYAEIFELGNLILARYGFTEDKVERVKKP